MAKLNTTKGMTKTDVRTGSLLEDDVIYGTGGKDLIFGYNKNDELFGLSGEDRLFGGHGKDVLEGGEGADYLDGGAGTDEASYANADSAITVSLDTGTGSRGEALGDKLIDIENVTGSAYGDIIYGNHLDNVLKGLNGDDDLFGYGGNDDLFGGRHSDYLYGGTGNDFLSGGSGADVLWGGQNNDVLEGGSGNDAIYGEEGDDRIIGDHRETDYINGGADTDTIDYRDADISYWMETGWINLGSQALGGEGLGGDTLISIENVWGTDGKDNIQGNFADNVLHGWNGDDKLFGVGGSDELYGDKGNDTFFLTSSDQFLIDINNGWFDTGGQTYRIDGGDGVDTLDLAGLDSLPVPGVSVGNIIDLNDGGNIGAAAHVYSIENFIGSSVGEHINGNIADNDINGRGGVDYIDGGRGDDILTGGDGADRFIFTHEGWGDQDVITDFTPGEDRINLQGTLHVDSYEDLLDASDGDWMWQVGKDVVIHTSHSDSVTLLNTNLSDIGAGDFWFS